MKIVARHEPTYTIHDMPEKMLEAVMNFLLLSTPGSGLSVSEKTLAGEFRNALAAAYCDVHGDVPE